MAPARWALDLSELGSLLLRRLGPETTGRGCHSGRVACRDVSGAGAGEAAVPPGPTLREPRGSRGRRPAAGPFFPSGHSASSFAAATALAFFYPKAASVAYTRATVVALSRVHLGVHFPSDSAVGGTFGIGIGTLTAWLFKKRDWAG